MIKIVNKIIHHGKKIVLSIAEQLLSHAYVRRSILEVFRYPTELYRQRQWVFRFQYAGGSGLRYDNPIPGNIASFPLPPILPESRDRLADHYSPVLSPLSPHTAPSGTKRMFPLSRTDKISRNILDSWNNSS